VTVIDGLPREHHHGWKFIAFGPDDLLYVPVGAPCNVCESSDPRFASILRFRPDGTPVDTMARGVRNTVGFDWEPGSGTLWFTDNGRDLLGDDVPPDELNRATVAGRHYGFPACHGGTIVDPVFAKGRDCRMFEPPAIALGPHVAAIGMRFYRGTMFPEEYRGQVFIAEHGSWNRSRKIGYRVSLVRVKDGQAVSYQPFAQGWLQGEEAWGRPADLQELPDGSLLVSDEKAGAIYRITYARPS
jgi:glucose/arabinose dehydrogenase